MKSWQIASVGFIACILGCAGAGAYVPDQTEEETPLECAVLSLLVPSTISVDQGDTNVEPFSIINGNVSSLQSRAPGDATVTFTVSGFPNFVTGTVTPNPVTVGLDSLENVNLNLDATIANAGSAYNITITATEAGCTPVSATTSLNVFSNND